MFLRHHCKNILGLTLDNRLTFHEHLTNVSNKIRKTVRLLRKLQNILPRPAFLIIYKCLRPHLDYGDIMYDQAYNLSFHQKLESIQYNAALALTGAIRGSSREKLYQELVLGSLPLRRWYRKLCCFYKIYNKQAPGYLTELIPTRNEAYQIRRVANVPSLSFKHNFFKNTFFPSAILEWNKLDPSLQNSASYNVFKNSILKLIRPSPNKIFECHNPKGIKLVTRLRLGLSPLREYKFKHSFQNTLNPLCSCGLDIETTSHYFLHCPLFYAERSFLLSSINEIDSTILNKNESVVTLILLNGDQSFKDEVNLLILNATIDFVLPTNRFDEPFYLLCAYCVNVHFHRKKRRRYTQSFPSI